MLLIVRNRNLNLKDQFPREPRKAHVWINFRLDYWIDHWRGRWQGYHPAVGQGPDPRIKLGKRKGKINARCKAKHCFLYWQLLHSLEHWVKAKIIYSKDFTWFVPPANISFEYMQQVCMWCLKLQNPVFYFICYVFMLPVQFSDCD